MKNNVMISRIIFAGALLFSCNEILAAENSYKQGSNALERSIISSELIFKGTLNKISYKNSIEGIPHTFARYRIDEIIKGHYDSDTITLRFVGGYFDETKQKHLTVSNSPKLEKNEQSILMVHQNGIASCPLVGCEHGRFAIDNGNIISANGSAVTVDAKGSLSFVSQQARNLENFSFQSHSTNLENFIKLIKSTAANSASRSIQAETIVHSVNSSNSFNAHPSLVTAGVAATGSNSNKLKSSSLGERKFVSDFDRWEEEQLNRNDGNPVLSESYPGNRQ